MQSMMYCIRWCVKRVSSSGASRMRSKSMSFHHQHSCCLRRNQLAVTRASSRSQIAHLVNWFPPLMWDQRAHHSWEEAPAGENLVKWCNWTSSKRKWIVVRKALKEGMGAREALCSQSTALLLAWIATMPHETECMLMIAPYANKAGAPCDGHNIFKPHVS